MKKQIITLAAVLTLNVELGTFNCSAQSKDQPISFTLADRDRLIQMQIKMDERFESIQKEMNSRFESVQKESISLRNEMNTRFESQQRQLDDLKNFFYWGFGIMITLMIVLFGYLVWDRRTALEPVREKTTSLVYSLREYAKEQPKLAEILRSHGLL